MQGKQLAEADAKVAEGSRVYFRANSLGTVYYARGTVRAKFLKESYRYHTYDIQVDELVQCNDDCLTLESIVNSRMNIVPGLVRIDASDIQEVLA